MPLPKTHKQWQMRNLPKDSPRVRAAHARRLKVRYENDPSAEMLVNEALRKREAALRKAGR